MKRVNAYTNGDSFNGSVRDPMTAAMLSVVPGLGQFYNGDNRKGFLFLDVGALNFVLVWFMIFSGPIVKSMREMAAAFHMRADDGVLRAFEQMHVGTPVGNILLLLVLGFAAYAVRDAYDTAMARRRRALYPDAVLDIPEAASGSYLLHLAMIISCCVLAAFFIAPRPAHKQVTEIVFVTNQEQTKPPVEAKMQANTNHESRGQVDPRHLVQPASSRNGSEAPAHHQQNQQQRSSDSAAAPKTVNRTQEHRAEPTPVKPVEPVRPTPVQPTPVQPAAITPPAPVPLQPTVQPRTNQIANLPPTLARMPVVTPSLPAPVLPSAMAPNAAPAPTKINVGGGVPNLPVMPRASTSGGSPSIKAGPMMPVSSASSGTNTAPAPVPAASSDFMKDKGVGTGHSNAPAPQKAQSTGSGAHDLIAINPSVPGRPGKSIEDTPGGTDRPGPPGPAAPATQEINFGAYMAELQRKIKHNWFPQRSPTSQRTMVRFKVSPQGELSDLSLVRSSGSSVIDEAAMKAVRNSAPLPPLPRGANEAVDIEFTFDYNVFGNSHADMRF